MAGTYADAITKHFVGEAEIGSAIDGSFQKKVLTCGDPQWGGDGARSEIFSGGELVEAEIEGDACAAEGGFQTCE
jgi:hypothetical protein